MAIYVFKMKTFTRSAGSRGSRATSAAAYRAGERIRDIRTGALYNHQRRQDVMHKEIVLPARLAQAGSTMEWAHDRQRLWNAAEHAETRRNARVAREFTLALPHELPPTGRRLLAQRFAHELADRYQHAVDLVIHEPRGDARNFHAHLLTTTREVTPSGLGPKTTLELSGTERHRRGLLRWSEERTWLRERWAEVTNQALQAAHLPARVSPQFPVPDPTRAPRIPLAAWHMERAGRRSFLAERIRARHRQLLERAAPAAQPSATPASGRNGWLERVRERAQAAWLAVRERWQPPPAPAAAPAMTEPARAVNAHHPAAPSVAAVLAAGAPHALDELARQSAQAWLAYRTRQHGETENARLAESGAPLQRTPTPEMANDREQAPRELQARAERDLDLGL